MKAFLVHLNVQIPDDTPATPEGISHEIEGALEVGINEGQTPVLWLADTEVALTESV